jgi:hypothetical protein
MTIQQLNSSNVPIIRLKSSMNKLSKKVLFPQKLEKANDMIAKSNWPIK